MRALEPTLKVPTAFPRFLSRLDSTLCGFVIIQVVISAPAISAADLAKETRDYTATRFFFNRLLLHVKRFKGMVDHAL